MRNMFRISAVTLSLAIVFASSSLADSQNNKPLHPNTINTEAERVSKTQQYGHDDNPFSIRIIPTPADQAKATNEETYRQQKSSEDRALMWATIGLAFVTTVLAVFTGLLWNATRELSEDARKTATQQAEDMKAQLAIGKESADAAKKSSDALERQLRAYLHIEQVELPYEEGWHTIRIDVRLKNFGQITATNVEYWIGTDIREFPLSSTLSKGEAQISRIGAIAPQAIFAIRVPSPFIDRPDNHQALYLYGVIQYFDGFTPRETPFRYMRRGSDDWTWHGEMETCQDGNDAT